MTTHDCPREPDVVAAVLSNRWADGCEEELRVHAADCEVCREAVTVTTLLHEDDRAAQEVQLPSSGQVWWRSAIRARVEAAQAAERPMTWAHGVAGACAVGLIASLLGLAWPYVQSVVASISLPSWTIDFPTETVIAMAASFKQILPFVLGALAFVILAPIAIYLATNDE